MKMHLDRRRLVAALWKIPLLLAAARFALPGGAAAASVPDPGLAPDLVATLRRIGFLLFPYPELGPAPYVRLADGIAEAAARDPALKRLVAEGIAALDQSGAFLSLDEAGQLGVLARAEATPFFRYMLQATRNGLFNNPVVWAHIGYEGSSLEFGGYLGRGLNDIGWLDGT